MTRKVIVLVVDSDHTNMEDEAFINELIPSERIEISDYDVIDMGSKDQPVLRIATARYLESIGLMY
jgi:hypothetical protein